MGPSVRTRTGVSPALAKMPKSGCRRLCQDLLEVGNVSNIRSRQIFAGMLAMLLFHRQEMTGEMIQPSPGCTEFWHRANLASLRPCDNGNVSISVLPGQDVLMHFAGTQNLFS